MESEIEKLKKEIEHEQFSYDNACEYPTQTDQYYKALENQRQKLAGMKRRLLDLEKAHGS